MAAKTKTGRSAVRTIGRDFREIGTTFAHGDAKTRLSYVVMGLGPLFRGQIVKGTAYLGLEILFFLYLFRFGFHYLSRITTLGTVETTKIHRKTVYGDNSFLILLFGILTIVVIAAFLFVWRMNVRENMLEEAALKQGRALPENRKVLGSLLDRHFDKTLLAVPVLGIFIFTVLPLIFMILIAFTNYDGTSHKVLFDWVGMKNFGNLLNVIDNSRKANTFFGIAGWTLIWAVAATFSNYILGLIVALMINKKGIKLKSVFRTMFVITIAVPQFVSLLLMSQILAEDGAMNILLAHFNGGTNPHINFLGGEALTARLTVIIVNCWVGIPYTILSMSGILMNIPEDLYESARIDGASPYKTFTKITLPYMIFVTTPQLITQFVGNINNFNVIFLLTHGNPSNPDYYNAGHTDILVTWLYNISMGSGVQDYGLASAIGILVFIICATLSLIIYNNSKSMKDEEAFS